MDNLQPGQMLGVYRIVSKVGQGGMATVYKAYQASMDRNVAIKVLPGQLAESPEFAARFQQEARIIARLEHPHILPVFDYGEDNGITYFVMRYLDAGSLKDKMLAGPLALTEIDRVFTQLADALGYAHGRGIIHRDLKPANALIDSDGNLFLTDFGIAKLLESASPRLTQTDAIMGTPAYISPEQAQAQPVDRRSDIYSLGIILYELVTGRVPYVADTPLAVILKHLSDPLPLPSIIKPDIPDSIEQVILKALAKNPADRFATTTEFVTAWKSALQDVETVHRGPDKLPVPISRPASVPRQPQGRPASNTQTLSKSGRNTTGLAIGCIALVCLAIVVGGGFVFASGWLSQPTSTSVPPTQPPIATQTPLPPTSAPSPTAVPQLDNVFLDDDFSSEDWGTLTDSDNSIEYKEDALNMTVYAQNWFVWSTPNGEVYEDIHMEVTALNNDTDVNTAFGLMCHQQSNGDSYYYFAITPAGQYVIARAASGEDDFFLTNNNEWEFSDRIAEEAPSYRIGADCGIDGTLTLYVDGDEIDSVVDTTYTSGGVGLITWSSVDATNTDVSFDDYLLTDLP